jgi:hypothetical protein
MGLRDSVIGIQLIGFWSDRIQYLTVVQHMIDLDICSNYSYQGQTWAEFSTLEAVACMTYIESLLGKTVNPKFEIFSKTTLRSSPVACCLLNPVSYDWNL